MPRRNSLKRRRAKTTLRLPDLEQSKNAVLHSLAATSSQESYGHAIDEFIGWYCSEPRLAFNRAVVLRYRPDLAAGIRRVKGAKRLGGSRPCRMSTKKSWSASSCSCAAGQKRSQANDRSRHEHPYPGCARSSEESS